METYARPVAVAYVLLAALSVVAIDLRIALVPAGVAALLLFAGGLIALRPLRLATAIPWPALLETPDIDAPVVIIEGTPCPFQGYEQELVVIIGLRRWMELLTCVALALASLYAMLFLPVEWKIPGDVSVGIFGAEIACGVGLAVLIASLRWFVERCFLRRARYTIGTIIGRDQGFIHSGVAYQFLDHQHERRGGHGPLRGRESDNAVLVLYDRRNSDQNIPPGAFMFHSFRLHVVPSRRRR
ncbi:MAG: hypothetical protein WAM79_17360 [Candidatus Sulfotelmatobacter sp.]